MAAYFSVEQVAELNHRHMEIRHRFAELRQSYILRVFESERAREYAVHGFGRRLGTLVRSIDQVFRILPPDREDIPERDELIDATIAIQSFVLNVFGCLDNLAWIWVHEKAVKKEDGDDLSPRVVSLGNKLVRRSFSNEFRTYLDSRQDWFRVIKDFRDSLAHRIPLYIPPYIVTPASLDEYNRLENALAEALSRRDFDEHQRLQLEQKQLVSFRPWMTHSLFENVPSVVFHPQLLADYATIDEFGRTMLNELNR